MDVGGEEEHRAADRVQVADEPAVVDVAADALDRIEGALGARLVVHGEHDARRDLRQEKEGQDAAERPQVVQVARRREVDELGVHQAPDWEAPVHPFAETRLGLVARFVKGHGGLALLSRS
jgi:hypothetical protein